MTFKAILLAVLMAASSSALAAQGTPQEQAACRSDVRKYCHALPPNSSGRAFLTCLQAHRDKLKPACLAVLVSHGQ
jgi:hypothetical protein